MEATCDWQRRLDHQTLLTPAVAKTASYLAVHPVPTKRAPVGKALGLSESAYNRAFQKLGRMGLITKVGPGLYKWMPTTLTPPKESRYRDARETLLRQIKIEVTVDV